MGGLRDQISSKSIVLIISLNLIFISLPYNKILVWTKSKAFAEDKLIQNEKLKLVQGRVKNIVGKGENVGYQHFLLFHNVFKIFLFQGR